MKRKLLLLFAAIPLVAAGCSSASDEQPAPSSPAAGSTTSSTAPTAAPAGADAEAEYLSVVRPSTPSLNDQNRVFFGYEVCVNLTKGGSLNDSVFALQLDSSIPREEAAIIAMSAPAYLCTEHKDRIREEIQNLPG